MAKLVFDRGRESGGSRADGLCAAVAGPRFTATAFSRHTVLGPFPPHGGALLENIGISLAWQVVTVLDGAKRGRADRWLSVAPVSILSVRQTSLASPPTQARRTSLPHSLHSHLQQLDARTRLPLLGCCWLQADMPIERSPRAVSSNSRSFIVSSDRLARSSPPSLLSPHTKSYV